MPAGLFPFPPGSRFRAAAPRPSASLRPTLIDRASTLVRPGWARTVAARRGAAALLALVALVTALRDGPSSGRSPAVVAVRDLSPGYTLTLDDVELVDRESSAVPSGALTVLSDAVGHTLSGPVPAGETLVSVRMLGPRLAGAATGNPDARVVPIRLADAGVGDLLREGDLVDVLTVAPGSEDLSPSAQVLATGATVVLAHTAEDGGDQRERVVLLALAPEQATAVAAASLVSALTVTLH